MSTITTLNSGDSGPVSRGVLNTNLANLNSDKIETSVISTDGTLASNSDAKLPSEKAVKTYVDAQTVVSTSGVSAGPATSSTQTITHGLGATPTIIRIYGVSSTNTTGPGCISTGTYNSTGNRCSYLPAGSSTRTGTTSTTFAVRLAINSSGSEANVTTGVIQNVGATTFDIVWTAAGSVTDSSFIWEAQ